MSVIMIGTVGLILFSKFLTKLLLNVTFFDAWTYMPTLLCAVAIETLVSFLASVYLVRKKSVHSFVTALASALSNILLNWWLIPIIGALGAAIATLISYAIVLVLRMVDTQRMIPFKLCLPRLFISAALLFGAAAITTLDVTGRFWWTFLCAVAICAINAPALLKGLRAIVAKRMK